MTTADAVRDARQAAGLTQHQLADKAGVSTATVYRIEAGKHSPTRSTLRVIADALATTVDDFTMVIHTPEVAKTSHGATKKPAHGDCSRQADPRGRAIGA